MGGRIMGRGAEVVEHLGEDALAAHLQPGHGQAADKVHQGRSAGDLEGEIDVKPGWWQIPEHDRLSEDEMDRMSL